MLFAGLLDIRLARVLSFLTRNIFVQCVSPLTPLRSSISPFPPNVNAFSLPLSFKRTKSKANKILKNENQNKQAKDQKDGKKKKAKTKSQQKISIDFVLSTTPGHGSILECGWDTYSVEFHWRKTEGFFSLCQWVSAAKRFLARGGTLDLLSCLMLWFH